MKKIYFVRRTKNFPLEVVVKEVISDNAGHGYIVIADKAIEEAGKLGLIKCVNKGKALENKYYMVNPFGYSSSYYRFILNKNSVTLACCDYLRRGYKAYALMDSSWNQISMLKIASLHMSPTKGKKFHTGRHVCMSGFGKNTPLPNGVTKKILEAPLLAALSEGLIKSTYNLETHHIRAHWDMRMCSIACLSQAEHDKENSKSHRLDVVINDWEELVAFINFVNSPQYFRLFK